MKILCGYNKPLYTGVPNLKIETTCQTNSLPRHFSLLASREGQLKHETFLMVNAGRKYEFMYKNDSKTFFIDGIFVVDDYFLSYYQLCINWF